MKKSKKIETILTEDRKFHPQEKFKQQADTSSILLNRYILYRAHCNSHLYEVGSGVAE